MPYAFVPSQTPSGFMKITAPVHRLQASLAKGATCALEIKMCVLPQVPFSSGITASCSRARVSLVQPWGVQCRVPTILASGLV